MANWTTTWIKSKSIGSIGLWSNDRCLLTVVGCFFLMGVNKHQLELLLWSTSTSDVGVAILMAKQTMMAKQLDRCWCCYYDQSGSICLWSLRFIFANSFKLMLNHHQCSHNSTSFWLIMSQPHKQHYHAKSCPKAFWKPQRGLHGCFPEMVWLPDTKSVTSPHDAEGWPGEQ